MDQHIHIGTSLSLALPPAATITLGRAPGNDVVVSDDTVSRSHARLERHPVREEWLLTDLDSRNGSFVNGLRVTAPVVVRPGDRIQLGSCAMNVMAADPAAPAAVSATQRTPASDVEVLSPRELEIVRLVADGSRDREIAERLCLSVKTVHSHLDRIRDKTGLRRRAEIARLATAMDAGSR